MNFEERKKEHKKQFDFLDMFLGVMSENFDDNKYRCLKLEHIINNKMPELLKIGDNELQEELALLLSILEQADKCINDIFEKGNIKLDE